MANIIIIGAGGFGLEILSYLEDIARAGSEELLVRGFMDDTKEIGTKHGGCPVIGGTDFVLPEDTFCVLGVGAPENREVLATKLKLQGAVFMTLIHPSAVVARSARLSEGVIVTPLSFVGADAAIGVHGLLNIHSSVGHECNVGDYAVLSPYASLNGAVTLDSGVFLGSYACVTSGRRIGKNAKIAAGAVVYSDVPAGITALGNPARFRMSGEG